MNILTIICRLYSLNKKVATDDMISKVFNVTLIGEKKGCKSPDIPSYVAQVYSKEVVHNLYISETEKKYLN